MTDVANGYFTDPSNRSDNPAIVPAHIYEDAIRKHFVIDDETLDIIRNYGDRYDAKNKTYSLTFVGGFGGLLRERDYFAYASNDDGTYDLYYRTITYQYLEDVLEADGATMDDVTVNSNGKAEYKGITYTQHWNGKYYAALYIGENTGKKHTVELNGDVVRIISTTNYTEADLPDSFDDVAPHEHEYECVPFDGVNHKIVCSVGKEEIFEEHNWNEGEITKHPTTTETGTITYTITFDKDFNTNIKNQTIQ